jgi:tripartite-type tricarboxylate transporter receptor subunit TctC
MFKRIFRVRTWAVACVLSLPLAGGAMAQSYPSRPISLVVPFPAGGTTDVLARALGQELAKSLGQPVVVENKPGAGSTMGAVHHTIATSVYKSLHYDFQKDFAPVTTVALVPNVLVVNPKLDAKTVQGLLALAKAAPGKLTYGSNGMGTGQHLIGAQFEQEGQVKLLHVPYKGSGPLTTDLLGGQIDMSFDTITPVLAHIQSGKLRALAVTTNQRSAALPDVPTMEEAGIKPFNMGTWFGVLAPAAAPKEVVARLNAEMVKIIKSPDFSRRMAEIGAVPIGDTPDQMRARIGADTENYAKLVKDAKVAIN